MNVTAILGFIQQYGVSVALVVAVLGGIIEFVPVKLNPWSAVFGWLGKKINKNVVTKLDEMKKQQDSTEKKLVEHVKMDDQRDADMHRYRILRFNTEIMRGMHHTEEEFAEILYNIKCYEHYCRDNPDYENNRAVLAIENIERVYRKCMETHDFLECGVKGA